MKRNAFIALIAVILLSGCPVLNTGPHNKNKGDGGTYTVSFSVNGGVGTAPAAEKVVPEESVTLPSGNGLSKANAVFGGWNTKADGTGTHYDVGYSYTPTSSITLYATWNPTYTVTFDLNGGTGTVPASRTINAGDGILIPGGALTKAGSIFSGWNTKADGMGDNYRGGTEYTPSGSITLYATWIPQDATYTVTYNLNGGSGTLPAEETQWQTGNIIYLPLGSGLGKTGFAFGGWNTKADGTGINYGGGYVFYPSSNVTLYAQWDSGYTITYNINGGSGGTVANAVTVGAGNSVYLASISSSSITRTGFVSSGWNTKADGTGDNYAQYDSYTPTGNVTLYIRWVVPASSGDFSFREDTASSTLIGYTGSGGAVTIPATYNGKPVTAIEQAFINNKTITSVSIPDSVTTIGDRSFYSCTSLASVTIPNNVTTIGYMAFSYCSSLSSVTIPNSVTTIGSMAFSYCSSLSSVTIPGSVTSFSAVNSGLFVSCTNLRSVVIENGVTHLPGGMFGSCSNLTSVSIPDSVTIIGSPDNSYPTFSGCTSLTSITLPRDLQVIYGACFGSCGLTSITIPASVTFISGGGIAAPSLREVTFLGASTDLDATGATGIAAAYAAGGAGRYTASGTGTETVWTKQ